MTACLPCPIQPPARPPQRLARTALAMACTLMAGAAFAQTDAKTAAADSNSAAPESLKQVTVTARKRKETMLEVPISIQTLSERELRAAAITDVKELGAQTGFNFSSSQGSGAQGRAFGVTTFRGLQGDLNFPWENSGGVFIDGIFISGGVASIGMSDVARVEVLKGPQNAFFGRSTFGGAVNFITKNPASKLGGTVNASVDHRGSTDIDGTIEGPLLADKLNGRLSFGGNNKVAQFHATDGGDLGAQKTSFVTGTLYFTPTDSVWLRLRGHYQRDEDSSPASGYIAAGSNNSCTGKSYTGNDRNGNAVSFTPSVSYFCGGVPSFKDVGAGIFDANTALPANTVAAMVNNSLNDPFLAKSPKLTHSGMLRDTTRLSAQAGISLPKDMDLALNAGYNESASTSIYDLDVTKTNNFYALQTNPTKDLTLDARLSSSAKEALRGIVGVSYFTSTYQLSQIDISSVYGQLTPTRSTGNYLDLHSVVPAVYASAEYDINKQWTVSTEARYQSDKIEFTSLAGVTTSNTSKNFLPRLTLRYKPDANLSAYVNFARGVQPLTVNGGYTNASAAGKAYLRSLYPDIGEFTAQPKLDSIEIGLKQQVNSSLQFAAAVYDQKWKNRLSGSAVFNPTSCGTTVSTPACPFSAAGSSISISNDAHIRGLELTVDAQLNAQWVAGAYVDIKHATWDKFDAANASVLTGTAVNFNGNDIGRVPKYTLAANTTYRYGLSDGWSAYTRGDLSYTGKRWDSDFNLVEVSGYSRVDLRQVFEKKDFSIEFFAKNLFDSRGWASVARSVNLGLTPLVNFSQQGLLVNVQDARSVGARVRYSF